jgi:hypothetical protein
MKINLLCIIFLLMAEIDSHAQSDSLSAKALIYCRFTPIAAIEYGIAAYNELGLGVVINTSSKASIYAAIGIGYSNFMMPVESKLDVTYKLKGTIVCPQIGIELARKKNPKNKLRMGIRMQYTQLIHDFSITTNDPYWGKRSNGFRAKDGFYSLVPELQLSHQIKNRLYFIYGISYSLTKPQVPPQTSFQNFNLFTYVPGIGKAISLPIGLVAVF